MTSLDLSASTVRVGTFASAPVPKASRPRRLGGMIGLARARLTPGRVFSAGAAVYLVLCAIAFFVVRPTTLLYFADYWEHRAIISEVIRHGTRLADPIYGEGATSRQFTPWSLALGYLARIAHVTVDTAMAWGAMAVSVIFVVGVHGFARARYAHRWAPALLLGVLLCGWGLPPIIWTGFYALRSQLHGNYYPAGLVFALSFVAWSCTLRLMQGAAIRAVDVFLLWSVVAGSVITHPLNAVFLVAGCGAFALLEPATPWRRRAAVMLVVAAGVASTTLWPWFDPLSLASAGLVRGQSTFNNFAFFYQPAFIVTLMWPTAFAILALPGLARQPGLRMPLVALAFTFAAYVVGGLADVSVSHRLLAYVILWLHLLLVKAGLDLIDGRPPRMLDAFTRRSWRGVIAVFALLAVAQVALAVEQLTTPWTSDANAYPLLPVDNQTQRAVASLPPGARVLGWDSAALVLPSHGVLVAVFPRPMPLSPSDHARQADYTRFFTRGTSTCERLAIADRWHATHIAYLAFELRPALQRELKALGPAYAPATPWRIIAIPPGGLSGC